MDEDILLKLSKEQWKEVKESLPWCILLFAVIVAGFYYMGETNNRIRFCRVDYTDGSSVYERMDLFAKEYNEYHSTRRSGLDKYPYKMIVCKYNLTKVKEDRRND